MQRISAGGAFPWLGDTWRVFAIANEVHLPSFSLDQWIFSMNGAVAYKLDGAGQAHRQKRTQLQLGRWQFLAECWEIRKLVWRDRPCVIFFEKKVPR